MTQHASPVDLHWQRLFLTAKEVQEGFRCQRGRSISRTTLDTWEGQGMHVLRRGGRKWYRWAEVWTWFLTGSHATRDLDCVS